VAGYSPRKLLRWVRLTGGAVEQDPDQWWAAVRDAAREAIAAAALPPESVIAVRVASQWAVTVPVDASGRAIANAVSWMDSRGGRHVRALVDAPIKVAGYSPRKLLRWVRLTGGAPVLSGFDGLGHVLHLMGDRPEVYAAADALLEPMDYLNLRLTGRAAASYGSIFPYWLADLRRIDAVDYDSTLLRWTGVDREKLPELLPMDAVVGTLLPAVADELGLDPSTAVLTGLTDLQSAAIGAGSIRPEQGYFSIGTTSWLSAHIGRRKTDIFHQLTTMPSALGGRRMIVAEQGAAGRCLEFVRDNVLYGSGPGDPPPPPDAFEILERQAAAVPAGSEGLIFTPWVNGVGAPGEDSWTRSAFFNQTLRTTRAHYARATMEGVAYNLRWLRDHVERFAKQRFDRLNFIGGGAQSRLWCQIFADVLGREVRPVANPRFANAVGTALSAFAALGELEPDEIPAAIELAPSHRPDRAAAAVHDRQFELFGELYKHNRRIYRRLNR
ncbi:MAG: xylulokinase, partial [Solirubrobacterales bacterium]